jgi:hypothetical protein
MNVAWKGVNVLGLTPLAAFQLTLIGRIWVITEGAGDSGEAERSFRREAERHSGIIPNTIGA